MKQIMITKQKKFVFEFSPDVDMRDVKLVQRTLFRQFRLFKRRARLERMKARRLPELSNNGQTERITYDRTTKKFTHHG